MSGANPITRNQVKIVLKNTKDLRNNAFLSLGFSTGYRISELLRITIKDVAIISNGNIHIFDSVSVSKTKNGSGRTVRMNTDAKNSVEKLVKMLISKGMPMHCPLFGRAAILTQAFTRQYANKLLKKLILSAGVFASKISSHTLRKTFAQEMYRILNHDLVKLQYALGHKSVNSTIAYIGFLLADVDNAISQLSFT